MLVLNMGIPRSGTTWAFNVLRCIFLAKGQEYVAINPQGISQTNAALRSAPETGNVIIHTHDVTENIIEYSCRKQCPAFFNIRDPRDVVVSQMRLHDASFSEAVRMTYSAFHSLQTASRIPGLMLIPYEHITRHAEALVFQMAMRIGKYLNPAMVSEIVDRTSITQHRRRMEQVVGCNGQSKIEVNSCFSGRRNVQYDAESLITDRHIQSGKTGRWKEELGHEEQDELDRVFASIIGQLGFD
jgi:hypothetical protein